jgi:hypothetical protein
MGDNVKLTEEQRKQGAIQISILAGMLGAGVAWIQGFGLLVGLGCGLIWCVIGLLFGVWVSYVWLD